jgi:hypothetical protein
MCVRIDRANGHGRVCMFEHILHPTFPDPCGPQAVPTATLKGHTLAIQGLAVAQMPDRSLCIVSVAADRTVRVWTRAVRTDADSKVT